MCSSFMSPLFPYYSYDVDILMVVGHTDILVVVGRETFPAGVTGVNGGEVPTPG